MGMMMVNGPGQKAFISFCAASGTEDTISGSMERLLMWTISGLSAGRPFAAKMAFAASALVASAPSP